MGVVRQGTPWWRPVEGRAPVILSVIPPGTTHKTGGDQADGTGDLTSKDATRRYPMDSGEPTRNRKVEGWNRCLGPAAGRTGSSPAPSHGCPRPCRRRGRGLPWWTKALGRAVGTTRGVGHGDPALHQGRLPGGHPYRQHGPVQRRRDPAGAGEGPQRGAL